MKRFVLESTAWLLCLAAVSLASCGDDGNDGGAADSVPKELSVAPAELSFVAAGETKTLAVKARNVEWHAATAADWLTLVSDSGTADGTVSVKADPHTGDQAREATIALSGEGVETVSVRVIQAAETAGEPRISANVERLAFTSGDYHTKVFEVESDTDWVADSEADWITLDQRMEEGTCNGTVKVAVAKNTGAKRDAVIVLRGRSTQTPLVSIPVSQKERFESELTGVYGPFVADPANPVGEFFITPAYPDGAEIPTVDLSFILGAPLPIDAVTDLAGQIIGGWFYAKGLDRFEFRDDGTMAVRYRKLEGFDLNGAGTIFSEEVFTYPDKETSQLLPGDAITYYTENGKVCFCVDKAYLTAVGQSELQTDLTAMIEALLSQYPGIGGAVVSNETIFGLPLNYRIDGGKVELWVDRGMMMPFIPLISELAETMLPEEITVQMDPNDPQTAIAVPVKNLVRELLEGLFTKSETLEIGISLAKQ